MQSFSESLATAAAGETSWPSLPSFHVPDWFQSMMDFMKGDGYFMFEGAMKKNGYAYEAVEV